MKVLVLGGTGFLGSNLVHKLLQVGYEVGIYGKSPINTNPYFQSIIHKIKYIQRDFQLENHFDEILKGYDYIYHLISPSVPSLNNPLLDINISIIPSVKLFEAAIKSQVKKVIYFSSGGTVYGIPTHIPIRETDLTNPISAYGVQKLTIEKYLNYYNYIYGLQFEVLRISNPFGPGQRAFSNQGIIANVLGNHFNNKTSKIWGDGEVVRDYIYVDDVIDAAIKVIHNESEVHTFNIGSGKGLSVNMVLSMMERVLGTNIPKVHTPGHKQDVPVNVLDISLAEKYLNWTPQITFVDGIKKMISSWNPVTNCFEEEK